MESDEARLLRAGWTPRREKKERPHRIQRYVLVLHVRHEDPDQQYWCLFHNNYACHHYNYAGHTHSGSESALACRDAFRLNSAAFLGSPDNLQVIRAECYQHGECTGTVFTDEYVAANTIEHPKENESK